MRIYEDDFYEDDFYCPICGHDHCICTKLFKLCVRNALFKSCEYEFEECLKYCACMKGDKFNEKII